MRHPLLADKFPYQFSCYLSPPNAFMRAGKKMLSDLRIQELWLRLLGEVRQSGEVAIAKAEEGYHLVVRRLGKGTDAGGEADTGDCQALESRIPDLSRTRAVYLSSGGHYHLEEIGSLRDWAGELAADVESGAVRAFAVVDVEIFAARLAQGLVVSGWMVHRDEQDFTVNDGQVTERINLLRTVVRMVLSRGSTTGAVQSIVSETGARLARHAAFFARFRRRFADYHPKTLGRFFVAYPEESCVAVGWDYWQLADRTAKEAEETFEQGMDEFEECLKTPAEDWLPAWATGARAQNIAVN